MNNKLLCGLVFCLYFTVGCSDSSDNRKRTPPDYDFSPAEQWLQTFVEQEEGFDGASIIVVDKEYGVLHQASFGAHALDTIYQLASVSKVPSVSLLVAMDEDPELEFDLDTPIESYLPWDGVYPGVTTADLVSNTSGIPGLLSLADYGVHMCQLAAAGELPFADDLQTCGRVIYQTLLPGTVPPGTIFDYGGSQWHLAGAVAEVVGGDSWNNLFSKYIAEPCDLEVFEYGNMLLNPTAWTGYPDSLKGRSNPNIEGGAIASIQDVAAILMMHLNDGQCSKDRVMSSEGAERMRLDVGSALGSREWLKSGDGYGLGWWVTPVGVGETPTRFTDGGAFGSVAWIDLGREYGALVALARYDDLGAATMGRNRIKVELLPIIDSIIDNPL